LRIIANRQFNPHSRGSMADEIQSLVPDTRAPNFSVDVSRSRYPFCIVWQPLPVITWILPFVGHTGICNSKGVIHDFQVACAADRRILSRTRVQRAESPAEIRWTLIVGPLHNWLRRQYGFRAGNSVCNMVSFIRAPTFVTPNLECVTMNP
jgi:hypothetical protein